MAKFLIAAACCAGVLISSQAFAVPLTYTPSSSLPVLSEGGKTYALKDIKDGLGKVVAESNNGFGSTQGTGTITFKLEGCGKINKFSLWNNINRTTNGVTSYNLKFYGSTNHTLLKTISNITVQTNGPGGADVAVHDDLAGGIPFVGSIDMEITGSAGRIEIREVEIDGSARGEDGLCCP